MLASFKALFEELFVEPEAGVDPQHRLQVACAALMVEITYADHDVSAEEESSLRQQLASVYELDASETEDLIELAHREKHDAIDYYRFTSLINEHSSQQEKIELIENLWKIAYADNHLDKLEEHLIRRLSDLLYVPHADFIQAKHRIMEQQGS